MSTRETLMAALETSMAAEVKAAYSWVQVGCTREVPGDLRVVDQLSPEATPLVYLEEGDETYPEYANGLTRIKLPVMLTGVLKRSENISGNLQSRANELLAALQKAAWGWKHPTIPIEITADGPSITNVGPDQARVGVDIALWFWVKDSAP